jgi:DNA-binding protein YbaB
VPDIRNLEELAEYAYQQVERIQRMQEDLEGQFGTAESPRGFVRARTGPGGTVQDLRIDPSALRLPADELSAEVTAAINAAQQEYAKRADDIMAPVLKLRPSEGSVDALDAGMSRLDALADDLDRLSRRGGFAS